MKSSLLALGLLCQSALLWAGAPAAAAGAATTADPAIAATVVRRDMFPTGSVDFPHGVVATPDIEYANYTGFRPLLLDLYRQRTVAQQSRRPLVIYIHGGGWRRGDSRTVGAFEDFPAVLASLAARGYVVASINYRLSEEARFPAAVQDLNAAITFLRRNAGPFGIDPRRVVLWGDSAGAHLATLSAATCGLPQFAPPPSTGRFSRRRAAAARASHVSHCVQGVVAWYGIFDLARLLQPTGALGVAADVREFLGCAGGPCGQLARSASPVRYASSRTPPMLLLHGRADTEVPSSQTLEMAAALRRAGARVEVGLIDAAGHGWIGSTAGGTREASLGALRRTYDF
ncbi:MAG: alpha/beta hydrolase fold domain-containing protein, partial [Steroidobacteraceae bacterium]